MHFIDTANFERLLKKLSSEGELFMPVRNEDTGKLHVERIEAFSLPGNVELGGYRTVEPLKGFAQLLRYPVADYPSPDEDEFPEEDRFPLTIIVGARACDIYAMELVDKVETEGDFIDPFYKIRRDKMLVIGADCTECGKSCFCNLFGNKPWPERGFALSISKISGGFLVEAGDERGAKIIEENSDLFTEAREPQIKATEIGDGIDHNIVEPL